MGRAALILKNEIPSSFIAPFLFRSRAVKVLRARPSTARRPFLLLIQRPDEALLMSVSDWPGRLMDPLFRLARPTSLEIFNLPARTFINIQAAAIAPHPPFNEELDIKI